LCGWALLISLQFGFVSRAFMNNQGRPPGPRSQPYFVPAPGTGPGVGQGQGSIDPGMNLEPANGFERPVIDPTWMRIEVLSTHVVLAIFFYLNLMVFVPRVLTARGWKPYVVLVLVSFVVYLFGTYWIRLAFVPMHGFMKPPLFIGVPNFVMIFGLSLALRIMQDRAVFEKSLKEQETERLKSELSFLRSQVSPHFMFNVLNSLASLARKKSDQVESAIIQLSQLMRYTLYHADKKVSLEQEAEYISNYINLQKLRFGDTVHMHFHVDIEKRDLTLEPMLLIPFVENAFKHGVGMIHEPVIMIILEGSAYQISLTVRNKFNPAQNEVKDSSSGIGLQNVKRRLDLLYPDLYTFKTYTTDEHWFVTELKLIPQ